MIEEKESLRLPLHGSDMPISQRGEACLIVSQRNMATEEDAKIQESLESFLVKENELL